MKILTRMILVILIFLISTAVLIASDGLMDNINKSDVIVILGNKVELDDIPSLKLQSRLNKRYYLYKKELTPLIIVSGGVGIEEYDEAMVMKNYLVNLGIPENIIITDSNGVDSFNTAKNTKELMDEMSLDTALIVTNYYHISRTRLAFKKSGVKKVYSTHANYFEIRDLYSIPREVIGYYYYLLR